MAIPWFTISAQLVNFLILVWLLKRFLYKPILDAIDAREQHVAAQLADADAQKAEARKERDEFQHKNEEFDHQRDTLFGQAKDAANTERQRLIEDARKSADALRAKRQDGLKREQQSLNDEIERRTRLEVFAIARKTLTDLAGTSLEERVSEVFTRRLRTLDHDAKESLAKSMKELTDPVLVRSAFELPSEQRAAVQQALNESFSADIRIRFETAPNLISGIELTANGQKVAWSIADYLGALEKSVGELLKEQGKSPVKPKLESTTSPAVPEEAE